MVRALDKEVEVVADGGTGACGELPAERGPGGPRTAIPLLLPEGAVTTAHKHVDVMSGGGRQLARRSGRRRQLPA